MPTARRKVTLRAQWLGKMLRELRESNGYTLKEAAEYLQRDLSALSRFESGVHPIRRGDVLALMDLYGVEDRPQRDMLISLTGELTRTGWWEKYTKDDVWGSTIDLAWLESRAHSLRMFATTTVPGLLQTEQYARSLIQVANRHSTQREIERWVSLRLDRQRVLDREGEPAHLSAVVDESVLRRLVGGREIMRDQIRHLILMSQRANVNIQVLPFNIGAHSSPDGPFALVKMDDPFPEVAHIESPAGSIYLETEAVDRFVDTYDWLQEHSLGIEDTAALLADLEKELR
ncbi:Helix-turn-helix domain-containing protein [Nocardiopsis flavescens]|uniref:Helix-turn-helix domain-containing protein n=1 Tax=Nocardiopsis flavescens TaxID=758803 RepID=A0A1M6RH74_9ACTN|nr:helix-turn-helix transcriptional regulator [Nocardiopsis flavescens]SHK31728.1 Helix-turn-helix domain-containing protein [Nocardiopsis flavescens]